MVGYMDDDQGGAMQRLHHLTGDNMTYQELARKLIQFGVDMPSIIEVLDHLQERKIARGADTLL